MILAGLFVQQRDEPKAQHFGLAIITRAPGQALTGDSVLDLDVEGLALQVAEDVLEFLADHR